MQSLSSFSSSASSRHPLLTPHRSAITSLQLSNISDLGSLLEFGDALKENKQNALQCLDLSHNAIANIDPLCAGLCTLAFTFSCNASHRGDR